MELNGYFFRNILKKTRRRFALSAGEQALYQELADICNEEKWRTSFQVSNGELTTALNCNEKTLIGWRQSLINAGLIKYNSGKSRRSFGNYELVTTVEITGDVTANKGTVSTANKGTNSADYYKLKETKLLIIISGEKKFAADILDLFEQDVGLKMKWTQNGFPAEKFSDGLEQFMINNHGAAYPDLSDARRHFLFWLPNYEPKKEKKLNGNKHPGSFKNGKGRVEINGNGGY